MVTEPNIVEMSYADWREKYVPLEDCTTHGLLLIDAHNIQKHYEFFVSAFAEQRLLWTMMDDDKIQAGMRFVNRLYFVICAKPYDANDTITVYDEDTWHFIPGIETWARKQYCETCDRWVIDTRSSADADDEDYVCQMCQITATFRDIIAQEGTDSDD